MAQPLTNAQADLLLELVRWEMLERPEADAARVRELEGLEVRLQQC